MEDSSILKYISANKWTVLIVAVMVILLGKYLMKVSKERKETVERRQTVENSVRISEGGNIFNPKPYTDSLLSDFKAYSADRNIYTEIVSFDDDQIRAIWIDWDNRLKNAEDNPQKGKTLALAIYDAYWITRSLPFNSNWVDYAKKLHDRLKLIGLE